MIVWRTAWRLGGILVLILSGADSSGPTDFAQSLPAGPSRNTTVAGLERYAGGDFDAATVNLLGGRTIRALNGAFRRDSSNWIDAAPEAGRPQRTMIVAAVSVELMAASFSQEFAQYDAARDLIEWACERLRRLPVSEFEHQFHLASIALMQGARDESLLSGVYTQRPLQLPTSGSHVRHAGLRFPGEARFRLAFVTTGWEAQQLATWPLPDPYLTDEKVGMFDREIREESRYIEETQEALKRLFSDPVVGAEAQLRSGVIEFIRGRASTATPHLEVARSSNDPAVRYIAELVLGAVADQDRRPNVALDHYRNAWQAVPAAAAATALASALFRSGQYDEAAEVTRAFERSPAQADPWRLYGQRDYRFYVAYRNAMRRAVLQ